MADRKISELFGATNPTDIITLGYGDARYQRIGSTVTSWGNIAGSISAQTDLATALAGKASTASFTLSAAGLVPAPGSATGKFLRDDGTWQIVSGAGGGTWGSITGTLSAQTDLNTALAGKEPSITAGSTAQYFRGDKSWQTLNAAAVGLGNVSNTTQQPLDSSLTSISGLAGTSGLLRKNGVGSYTLDTATYATTSQLATTMVGANGTSGGAQGLVPSPAATDNVKYLRGDGTWQAVASGGGTWGSITGTLSAQSDLNTALAGKEASITAGTTSQYWRGDKSWQTLDKTAVGLGNVDNTSDANKPVSTATQTALNAKQDGDADLTAIAALAGTSGLLKKTAANTWSLDTTSYQPAGSYLTANQTITFTGDATGSGSTSVALTIANGAVTLAKMQTLGANVILGNNGGTGQAVAQLSTSAVTAMLNAMTGAGASTAGVQGMVPAPSAGDNTKFLRGDGTWVAQAALTTISNNTILGNISGSTAAASGLTGSQVTALLSGFGGATGIAAGTKGIVPAPAAGDQQKLLRGDGTWHTFVWGDLTGSISNQSDLSSALALKLDTTHAGTGGSSHATVISGGAAGFMLGSDKAKLDAISGTNTGDQDLSSLAPKASPTFTGTLTAATITATGNVTGANLSGTNTGDQDLSSLAPKASPTFTGTLSAATITATGNVTGANLSGTNTGDQYTSIGAQTILGNNTVASGAATALTSAQATALLTTMTGADGTSAGIKGLVPQPAATANTKFLRGDGTWAIPAGSGGGTWGSIGGLLSDQTDLQTALNALAPQGDITSAGLTQASAGVVGNTASGTVAVLSFAGLTGQLTTFGASLKGLVPSPGASPDGLKYLRNDGTWVTPSAGGTTTNAATFNNGGAGAASGATFDGSAAKTISYNTIGAQASSAQLTAVAGAAWSAGTQVLTLTAANTVTLKTVGSATGNILDKAAGDALYQPVGSYAPASGSANYQASSSQLTAVAGAAWSAGTQVLTLTAANTVTLKTVGSATGNILDKAAGDALYAPISGSANYQAASSNLTAYAGAAWSAGVQVPTLTAANTVALKTVGSASGNLLDKASGDTLYKPITPGVYTNATATGAVSIDATGYDEFRLTVTGTISGITFTNLVSGKKYAFHIIQDSTGSRTVTLGTTWKFGTDVTAYTATTTASKRDLIGTWSDGTNLYVVGIAKGY